MACLTTLSILVLFVQWKFWSGYVNHMTNIFLIGQYAYYLSALLSLIYIKYFLFHVLIRIFECDLCETSNLLNMDKKRIMGVVWPTFECRLYCMPYRMCSLNFPSSGNRLLLIYYITIAH